MRADLQSVTGDGSNLTFTFTGDGTVDVHVKTSGTDVISVLPSAVGTGAGPVSATLVGDDLSLVFDDGPLAISADFAGGRTGHAYCRDHGRRDSGGRRDHFRRPDGCDHQRGRPDDQCGSDDHRNGDGGCRERGDRHDRDALRQRLDDRAGHGNGSVKRGNRDVFGDGDAERGREQHRRDGYRPGQHDRHFEPRPIFTLGSPPTITNTTTSQAITDLQTIDPFSGVTIADTNVGPRPRRMTVTLSSTANGTLSNWAASPIPRPASIPRPAAPVR